MRRECADDLGGPLPDGAAWSAFSPNASTREDFVAMYFVRAPGDEATRFGAAYDAYAARACARRMTL